MQPNKKCVLKIINKEAGAPQAQLELVHVATDFVLLFLPFCFLLEKHGGYIYSQIQEN